MNRKTLLALALASAFGLSSFSAFAESDGNTNSPYTDKTYQELIAQTSDEKKDEKQSELIAQTSDEKKDEKQSELIA